MTTTKPRFDKRPSPPDGPSRRKITAAPLAPDSLAFSFLIAAQGLATVKAGTALNDGLANLWRQYPDAPPATRAAAQDLLFGSLRDFGRAACFFAPLLRAPIAEPTIDALLCIALHRLENRPDAAHTVVDQAVDAAAHIANGRFKSLVNAVLRSALRQWPTLIANCEKNASAHWRHPTWWIDMLKLSQAQNWEAALEGGNQHPPMALRINRRRASRHSTEQALSNEGMSFTPLGDWALQLTRPVSIAALPGYAEGHVSVQDWGAQQAAHLLDLHDGQRVLDACAAPGGKTAHMLECADARLVALDADARRTERIREQLQRLGLSAEVKTADCRRTDLWWDGRPFDRILADVPCSASGVARRHPDIKWLRRPADVANFATIQAEILDALWPLLAPGGKMLYVTCSVFAKENSAQIARFAAAHADCVRLTLDDGTLERQWLPNSQHDGFFFALLQKNG